MPFLNRCIWSATSSGTGSFVVSAAAQNGYAPASCANPPAIDGATYHYFAVNGSQHEEGDGVWSAATSTLTRATIRNSSNAGSAVNFTSAPTVYMGGPASNDMLTLATANQIFYVAPYGSDTANCGISSGTATTNSATATSSPTLHFASVPSFVVANMMVWDQTTGAYVGEVLSTGAGVVTLTANAASAVATSDVLAFAAPFATIQHAINVANSFNWNTSYRPTILVANGTYSQQLTFPALFNCPLGGLLLGNTTTPANVVISDTGTSSAVYVAAYAYWYIQGVKTSGTNSGWNFDDYCRVYLLKIEVGGALSGSIFLVNNLATVVFGASNSSLGSTLNVTATAAASLLFGRGGMICDNTTITFANAITFANYVMALDYTGAFFAFIGGSFVNPGNVTVTGGANPLLLTSGAFFEGDTTSLSGGVALTRANFPGTTKGQTVDQQSVFQPDLAYRIDFPSTGNTITMLQGQKEELVVPNASPFSLTCVLPPYPNAGDRVRFVTSSLITTLSFTTSDGSTTSALPTSLQGGAGLEMIYTSASNLWVPSIAPGDNYAAVSPTGVGYITGAAIGGTVTQTTSKSTGVTLNKATGQITMNAAALAASTTVTFVLTNSQIAAGDVLVLNHVSGGTAGAYALNAQAAGAGGSASINVRNITSGSLSDAVVIGFALIKGSTN